MLFRYDEPASWFRAGELNLGTVTGSRLGGQEDVSVAHLSTTYLFIYISTARVPLPTLPAAKPAYGSDWYNNELCTCKVDLYCVKNSPCVKLVGASLPRRRGYARSWLQVPTSCCYFKSTRQFSCCIRMSSSRAIFAKLSASFWVSLTETADLNRISVRVCAL